MSLDHMPAQITEEYLEELVQLSGREGPRLEFKRDQYPWNDKGTREFLADISSFANARGGLLLIGVDEEDACASEVVGIDGPIDEEIQRMNQKIESGIEPRIHGLHIKAIDLASGKYVVAVRVPRSWSRPHVVAFKNYSRFFARNSAGKYQLDVDGLRAAFLGGREIGDRIRAFRIGRVADLEAGSAPVALKRPSKLILHGIPFTSMEDGQQIDVNAPRGEHDNLLRPMAAHGMSSRQNFDGLVYYSSGAEGAWSYLQVFRTGALEAVDCSILRGEHMEDGKKIIPSTSLEKELNEALERYQRLLSVYGLNPPIAWLLTLTGVENYSFSVRFGLPGNYSIDRSELLIPEVVQGEESVPATSIARRLLDPVWQASGWERSPNYDSEGAWKVQ